MGEELFGPKVSHLSVIGTLIYLANCTRINISFSINQLAMNQSNNCLDMLMQNTFQTHIKPNNKQGMCLIEMKLLSHGGLLSKQWWLHHRIIQRL